MKAFRNRIAPMVAAAMALAPLAAGAGTVTMSVTYYTIAETDQDMDHVAHGIFTNEVQSRLGPDGLPVLNTAAYGCLSGCFTNTPLPADVTARDVYKRQVSQTMERDGERVREVTIELEK